MIQRLLNKLGYQLTKLTSAEESYPDIESEFWDFYYRCKPYTLTPALRLYALFQSVHYIVKNNIPGDFAECGVWKGGNPMMMALILRQLQATDRKIFLYDTFEGMSAPTTNDRNYKGKLADQMLSVASRARQDSVWCYSPLDEVRENMSKTDYPKDRIIFVKGKVEDTIPGVLPSKIALLRLDTDWYESTYHELVHLYPVLSREGVLIIDDYGYWEGCRKATDEYFVKNNLHPLLQRIDSSARLALKP